MISTRLRDKVIGLLRDRPRQMRLLSVAEETGIPLGWLKRLNQGKIREPSVVRCETLYRYLTGKDLVL